MTPQIPKNAGHRRPLQATLQGLPPEWPQDLLPAIQDQLASQQSTKLVVLDDDPTGTQTIHDLPVLTHWPVKSLVAEMQRAQPAFYLLTNSRSQPSTGARALNAEVGHNLMAAGQQAGVRPAVVSRSDSTLRGHFPGEVQALSQALGTEIDAWLLAPFFLEGGRYTIEDVHYVAVGPDLIPAGQTEFAGDAVFGYRASNLRDWVQEKSAGRIPAAEVGSISINDLRLGGPQRVQQRLLALAPGQVCVVNAASYRDMEVLVTALLGAEALGRNYLYRTAASFVRVRAGLAPRPLLEASQLNLPQAGGGLFMVGSYVPKTTAQLEGLLAEGIDHHELDVARLLQPFHQQEVVQQAADFVNSRLGESKDVAVFTSRKLVSGSDDRTNLRIGEQVSRALTRLVQRLQARPRYLVAKGGITSSDIATQGLGVRRAMVLGQVLPGVPAWELGAESRFPGMAYVVFPGNVCGREALAEVRRMLA